MDDLRASYRDNPLRGRGEYLLSLVCESAPREQLRTWLRIPLEHAAARGDFNCVTDLLAAGADAFVRRSAVRDRSPLVAAASGGSAAVISALLESGSAPDGEGWGTTMPAEDEGTTIGMSTLRSSSSSSSCEKSANCISLSAGRSPLHIAASEGHLAALRMLVRAGADTDVADDEGCSALHLAVFRGFDEAVEELVAAGANVSTSDSEGETPLHTACGHGSLRMVKAILRGSRDEPLCVKDNGGVHLGMSPLHRAALGGHHEVMKELLDRGSSLHALTGNARTALHAAAMSGSAGAVNFLLGRDLSCLEAKDEEGRTALHLAAGHRLGSDLTLRALLLAGADVEATTRLGETPLHKAIKALRVSAVKMLLDCGANESAIDADGRTPAAMASQYLLLNFPGLLRDMVVKILHMLIAAPADRIWRRQGWLIMLRAREHRAVVSETDAGLMCDESCTSGQRLVLCRGQGRPQRPHRRHRHVPTGVLTATSRMEQGSYREKRRGFSKKIVVSARNPLSSHSVRRGSTRCTQQGCTALAPDSGFDPFAPRGGVRRERGGLEILQFCSIVERTLMLDEDGLFRNILSFL